MNDQPSFAASDVPQGHLIIAQHFSAGYKVGIYQVPEGRQNRFWKPFALHGYWLVTLLLPAFTRLPRRSPVCRAKAGIQPRLKIKVPFSKVFKAFQSVSKQFKGFV
jgi:hypothetical protein